MKKLLITLLTLLCTVSFCSCSAGGNSTVSGNGDSAKNSANDDSQASDQESSKRAELMKYQVEINGKSLMLPFEYSELTALGYSLKDDDNLKANTYTIGTYVTNANDESLQVQFWNPSKETKKYSECQVSQIEVTLNKNLDVTLPGGLKFDENLTADQVIEMYGEADWDFDKDDYRSLDYEDGGFKSVKFMFYKEDNMKGYTSLTINHIDD